MYIIAKFIFIIFQFGGILFLVYFLAKTKSKANIVATINIKAFRCAIKYMIVFVILATGSFCQIFVDINREYSLQIMNNFFTSVSFLIFLQKLWKAINLQKEW